MKVNPYQTELVMVPGLFGIPMFLEIPIMSDTQPAEELNHPLFAVLLAAITQAMYGKGQRHGGASTPFLEQPWRHYADLHGRGFLTGQAAKKLEEAASTKNGEAFIQELRGAIVYCGMAILYEQNDAKQPETCGKVAQPEVVKAQQDYNRQLSDLLSEEFVESIQIVDSKTSQPKLNQRQFQAIKQIVNHPDWIFEVAPKNHDWEYQGFSNINQHHIYICRDCKVTDYRMRQQERPESNNICHSLRED